ncbi:hypothetical protein BH23GEM6_BH23GEM6_26090 [soil metagenome]
MKRLSFLLIPLLLVACQDDQTPLSPSDQNQESRAGHAPQDLAAWFRQASPEALALPQTVFASIDSDAKMLVFGVEHPGVSRGVQNVLARRGIPAGAYRIEISDPILPMSDNLRSEHRPTVGGLQIHWDGYVCTLGFNVDHGGGRSFVTNSHCTTKQGENSGTFYNQPSRTISSTPIADEAHDPAYSASLAGCSAGKKCRYSDASRALYRTAAGSEQGTIAKTTGVNNGSLTTAGHFSISSQNNTATSYSGEFHKVGRTTGWTSGNVTNTCATVNVSGSNIQLLCQTLVQRTGSAIVQGGDSGSSVFSITSGDNVELAGILWGGSSSGDLFVFSPLSGIVRELGSMTATVDGGGGDGGGGGGGEEPPCTPRGKSGNCK